MKKLLGLLLCAFALVSIPARAADTKIVLIAGRPSHGPGDHEFNAGTKLLVKCLKQVPGIDPVFVAGGWPKDESVFDGAKSVVFYMDGGGGHPMIQGDHLETMRKLLDHGVGLVCLHYAVEFPNGKVGDQLRDWLGGYFAPNWSVNPHWTANFTKFPDHPATRGVKPFKIKDEWYYHMRFRENMEGVTPILSDLPPADSLSRPDGTHSGNPAVREAVAKGEVQHVAWAAERKDGGRSFGFTGGHTHLNWGDPDFRKLVLNAILWSAKVEVPSEGVKSEVSAEELSQNLDPKGKK